MMFFISWSIRHKVFGFTRFYSLFSLILLDSSEIKWAYVYLLESNSSQRLNNKCRPRSNSIDKRYVDVGSKETTHLCTSLEISLLSSWTKLPKTPTTTAKTASAAKATTTNAATNERCCVAGEKRLSQVLLWQWKWKQKISAKYCDTKQDKCPGKWAEKMGWRDKG